MSRSVGNTIPEAIRPLLEGKNLESHVGLTFLLLTTGEDGWSYQAMLSVGEVLADGERNLRLALWPGSTTTSNLTRTGKGTLTLVHRGVGYSLRCSARRGADLYPDRSSGPLAFFEARVEDVLEDIVSYAILESGVTFRLPNPDEVLPRWRQTVAALRERETVPRES